MSMPRSIEVLKNDRKFQRVFLCLSTEIDAFFIFGARTIFHDFSTARVTFSPFARTRFFNADSIDVDASIDRVAQKS